MVGHHVDISAVASGLLSDVSPEGGAVDPVAILGELKAWKDQYASDYQALVLAMPMLSESKVLAAIGDTCSTDVLTDFGLGLANICARFDWLASLAEAGASKVSAILARRPDGNAAAREIAAVMMPGGSVATGDDQLVQAIADLISLENEGNELDRLADDATDAFVASGYAADAKAKAEQWLVDARAVSAIPALTPAGERAKAGLLVDLLATELDGEPSDDADPCDHLAFSLASDVLRRFEPAIVGGAVA